MATSEPPQARHPLPLHPAEKPGPRLRAPLEEGPVSPSAAQQWRRNAVTSAVPVCTRRCPRGNPDVHVRLWLGRCRTNAAGTLHPGADQHPPSHPHRPWPSPQDPRGPDSRACAERRDAKRPTWARPPSTRRTSGTWRDPRGPDFRACAECLRREGPAWA